MRVRFVVDGWVRPPMEFSCRSHLFVWELDILNDLMLITGKFVGYHVAPVPYNERKIERMYGLKHLLSDYLSIYSFN